MKKTIRFEQDKICKNSVRYSASKQALAQVGVVRQPFTIYVPNDLLPDGPPPRKLQLSIEFDK